MIRWKEGRSDDSAIFRMAQSIGLPGLFLVMFLEGTSFPFPGVIMVLTFGYLLSPGYLCIVLLAIGMSIS